MKTEEDDCKETATDYSIVHLYRLSVAGPNGQCSHCWHWVSTFWEDISIQCVCSVVLIVMMHESLSMKVSCPFSVYNNFTLPFSFFLFQLLSATSFYFCTYISHMSSPFRYPYAFFSYCQPCCQPLVSLLPASFLYSYNYLYLCSFR